MVGRPLLRARRHAAVTAHGSGAFRAWYAKQGPELRRIPVFPILFGESANDEMKALATLTQGRTFDARTQSLSLVFGEIRGYQ